MIFWRLIQTGPVTNLKKRMLEIVIEARHAAISEAVKVKRILPFRLRRMVGPFIFMDHAGPLADIPANPSSLDVLPHPYRAFHSELCICR